MVNQEIRYTQDEQKIVDERARLQAKNKQYLALQNQADVVNYNLNAEVTPAQGEEALSLLSQFFPDGQVPPDMQRLQGKSLQAVYDRLLKQV